MVNNAPFRNEEAKRSVPSTMRAWALDAKPASLKLTAKAVPIKFAQVFDPVMGVHASDVDPLLPQISAVNEAPFPTQPVLLRSAVS